MTSPQRVTINLPQRGGEMATLQWQASHDETLLFAHANGLCASAYKQFLTPLAAKMNVTAIDMRGHGNSTLPITPEHHCDWQVYAEDLRSLVAAIGDKAENGLHLAGHSMGAVSMVLFAAQAELPIKSLTLIEPVFVPEPFRWLSKTPLQPLMKKYIPIAKQAAARRSEFASRQIAQEAYGRKSFFKSWAPGVVADYLEDGMQGPEEGPVTLSCSPAWEAANFSAHGHHFWSALDRILAHKTRNITVFYAEKNSTALSFARRKLDARQVRTLTIDGTSHLAPQEKPERCAGLLLENLP
jgi:pimeloyl-ACP methyl ester carboxylesterase